MRHERSRALKRLLAVSGGDLLAYSGSSMTLGSAAPNADSSPPPLPHMRRHGAGSASPDPVDSIAPPRLPSAPRD
jgi:hypothetical protein